MVYLDSDHAHDLVMRQLVSGVLSFVGLMPISWTSKRQVTIESSSYSAELCTGRVYSEEAIVLKYMLSSLCVLVKVVTALCGENLGLIICCTNPDSELKNKHVDISYYKFR